jgi:pSer/pThr/pTyr-binding forkhead associated (FHA) protein
MTEQTTPVLKLKVADLTGRNWYAVDKEITIGRDKKNTIVIPNRNVSRVHAKIYHAGKGYILEDLQSHNGTLLNGRLARKEMLQEGDLICIADLEITFSFVSSDLAAQDGKILMTESQVGAVVSGRTEFIDLSELNKDEMDVLRKEKPPRRNS